MSTPPGRKLVVHQFRYMKDGEEIFLSGELLLVKVYAIVAGIEIDFVREFFPNDFPKAFVEGETLGDYEDVLAVLREMKQVGDESEGRLQQEALAIWVKKQLPQIVSNNLFGNQTCFDKFTKPIFINSMASSPAAYLYLLKQRRALQHMTSEEDMLRHFGDVVDKVNEILEKYKFNNNTPHLLDITLYAYLSPLFAIPPDLAFWEKHNFPLQRIRSFLLDFDDWLWCHAVRPTLLSVTPKLPEFLKNSDHQLEPETSLPEEAASPQQAPAHTKHNLIYGAFCVLSAAAALIASS